VATARYLIVEGILNRCALEDAGKDASHSENHHNADNGPAEDLEPPLNEDAEVKEQDADFGEADIDVI
jgi:hypothetical protein